MFARRVVLVLIFVAALAGSANAQDERDAVTIADCYLAAMQRKGYAFLSEDELSRRHDQIAAFVTKHLRRPLDEPSRAAVLASIDPCIDRLYSQPAGKIDYGTYGEGISHYLADLNSAPTAYDAAINTTNTLVSLPVLAWYVGYTHNWTDRLRSTATYSHVNLDSTTPRGVAASPYRNGEFVAVNLLYHRPFAIAETADAKKHNFYTGIEYLFGEKENLNGASNDAQRIMWVTAISK